METVTIATIQKNDSEQIRVCIREYKDRYYVDIRLHFMPADGVYVPSKKGITCSIELLPELLEGLTHACNWTRTHVTRDLAYPTV